MRLILAAVVGVLLLQAGMVADPAHASSRNCDHCFAVISSVTGGDVCTLTHWRGVLYAGKSGNTGECAIVFQHPVKKRAVTATAIYPSPGYAGEFIAAEVYFDPAVNNRILVTTSVGDGWGFYPFSVSVTC